MKNIDIRLEHRENKTSVRLVQGESNATEITFHVPLIFAGVDLRDLEWEVRGTSVTGNAFNLEVLEATIDSEIILPWLVGHGFTGYDGDLLVTVVGKNASRAEIAKFVVVGVTVLKTSDNAVIPRGNYIETLILTLQGMLTETQQNAEAAQHSAELANSVIQEGLWQINRILEEGMIITNPITLKQATVQTVVNGLYDLHRENALTAAEYDAYELSAAEYDALEMTVTEYETRAHEIIGR